MAINTKDILKLREETGAGVMAAKKALEEHKDYAKAKEALLKAGLEKAEKKGDRETSAGLVWSYTHNPVVENGGTVGVIVKIACETDFVAKTPDFQNLCKEVALQISAMDPKDVKELLAQENIRDSSKTIEDMVKGTIAKVGENIQIVEFARFAI